MKVSFANTLADICERIPGADVDVVSEALGSDSRIGRKYLTGGMGFAGPCFPRDNVALSFLCRQIGASPDLLETNDAYNRALADRFVSKILPLAKKGDTVCILGLAYKPLSHVIEESQGVALALAFADAGMRVVGYDPLAENAARQVFRDHVLVADSLEEALRDANLVVVTTPDECFHALNPSDFLAGRKSVTVVDFWRMLAGKLEAQPGIHYVPMGRFRESASADSNLRALWAD
jgi:UDPglucose 6-dehydrogenase